VAGGRFLIVAVGAFRLDSIAHAEERDSGTGGFAMFAESALPVVQNLNSKSGRDFYGLDPAPLNGVSIVPLRVHDGDEASCLNLNRAQVPRILGVQPYSLQNRGAFTFAQVAKGLAKDKPWLLLDRPMPDGTVPAIADQASIVWALGKKVGDTIDYTDGHGRSFKLLLVGALANSILQGSLIISEDAFVARFPSESGYRMFLIDAPPNGAPAAARALSRALQDVGLEVTPAWRRLEAFNAVQNVYLSTFQVLGGLGLLLGSVGLGIVVLRNVLERRGELALLQAVGFTRKDLHWIVLSEHGALLAIGLLIGITTAIVAVLPALLTPGTRLPVRSLALTLAAVLMNGALWAWLATRFALRGRLLEALRNN
ncbi:MAG: ABC transporter permease, partial [Candidatus Omnitrophica bacterium]|nr:ABC transporter permease [Candidatus Omnitrophota bacterium]